MHAVGLQSLGQRDRIVDDETHVPFGADRLQRFGQRGGLMLVHILHTELKGRHKTGRGVDRARESLREIAGDVERRYEIELGRVHPRPSNALREESEVK